MRYNDLWYENILYNILNIENGKKEQAND